ncbi:MAG: fumarate hydratase, partial [Candidatus Hadarchaeales archaeon]
MLSEAEFRRTIVEMFKRATTTLPSDVVNAIEKSEKLERNEIAAAQFSCMLKNLKLARKLSRPICQDTGIPIFFIELGSDLDLNFDVRRALSRALEEAMLTVPLRRNLVDPLTRVESLDGQPTVHVNLIKGTGLRIDLLIKGAGSENWSKLYMLKPTGGPNAVKRAVLFTLAEAGGQPCPPTIVGVGIGGSADMACMLAKKALLRPLNIENADQELAGLEAEITEAANGLGIGPMGLGGSTTVLGVHIQRAA